MKENPLEILFAGASVPVTYADPVAAAKRKLPPKLHVRALPLRHLFHVLHAYEHRHLFVELCSYMPAGKGPAPRPAFPDVAAPTGYWAVPAGWSDNLDDASVRRLFDKAHELNFTRAVMEGRAQIAAKKTMAPMVQEVFAQMQPMLEQLMAPLIEKLSQSSTSPASAPSSSAAAATPS